MEWLEHLEEALAHSASLFKVLLEGVSVLCVVVGIVAVARVIPGSFQGLYPMIRIRLAFGRWLALALEFQLGADVLATTIAPSFVTLGKLGALAVIRTFLNYFLAMELKEEFEIQAEVESDKSNPKRELRQSSREKD